jgi:hypothetical protein
LRKGRRQLRLTNERLLRSMIAAASGNHRDDTAVPGAVRIRVDALV